MSADQSSTTRGRGWARARLVVGVGLVAGLLWWLGPQWESVLAMATLRPVPLVLALLATTVATVVTSARWKLLAENMGGTALPYAMYVHAFTLTRVLGQFTSNLAMDTIGRGVALRSAGSERGLGHALTPIVLERVFDLALPVVVVGWAAAVLELRLHAYADVLLVATAALFLVLAVPGLRPLARLALAVYAWIGRRRAGFVAPPTEVSVSTPIAAAVGALSLARFVAVVLQFTAIAAAFGLRVGWRDMAVATPVAQIGSLLGITPGSWGFQELGWALGLRWSGTAAEGIALFVLAQRVAVTSFFGLLALASWPFARRRPLQVRSGSATPGT